MALGTMLGDTWGTRIIRILFGIGAILAVAFLALIPAGMSEANTAKSLLADGDRATATAAEGRAEVRVKHREGVDRREIMDPEVRAMISLPGGAQTLNLNDPEGAPETIYRESWAPAPAPYQGSFEVVYDAADPAGTVMAVSDAAEKADYTPAGNFVLAGFFVVWALAFLYPFIRTFRKQEQPARA